MINSINQQPISALRFGTRHSKPLTQVYQRFQLRGEQCKLERLLPAAADTALWDEWAKFQKEIFPELYSTSAAGWTPGELDEHYKNVLKHPRGRLLIVRNSKKQIIASATMDPITPEKGGASDGMSLQGLAIAPEYRNLKLGTRLFEIRLALARKMGCNAIGFCTLDPAVIHLATKHQFQKSEHFELIKGGQRAYWYFKDL